MTIQILASFKLNSLRRILLIISAQSPYQKPNHEAKKFIHGFPLFMNKPFFSLTNWGLGVSRLLAWQILDINPRPSARDVQEPVHDKRTECPKGQCLK
jgi:hypothetical protein